jgi:alpha,alpha-trehalose-phosphate synthase [UDP-forming]
MELTTGRTTWTKDALHQLVRSRLHGMRFIAVSNREPYIHRRNQGKAECIRPAGGLTTALDPILRATGGTWVAFGGGDADRTAVDARDHVAVPPEKPSYTLRRVWLDESIERQYYYGLANEGLWPLCHAAFHQPVFRLSDWESYRLANQIFADAVLEEAAGEAAFVFIQDYHFGLLPRMLKRKNPKLIVAQFWHIPWPNRENFRVFPWKEELLDGLLGNDLLGFHLPSHCANFLETVDQGIEARVDREHSKVSRQEHATEVHAFPISIDFEWHRREALGAEVERHMENWTSELGRRPEFLGVGIDRLDYTKGIPQRLLAVDRFLEDNPEYCGRFCFLQVGVPSRTAIEPYRRLDSEVTGLVHSINNKWRMKGWAPIYYCNRHLPQQELMALHRLADFCLVSSLHDGMNLVAKEFVASRTDEDGVLILSSFTGAARELSSAILVNPFSPDQMADAIREALTMEPANREARMRRMRSAVRDNNIYTWAAGVINALSGFRTNEAAPRTLSAAAGQGQLRDCVGASAQERDVVTFLNRRAVM